MARLIVYFVYFLFALAPSLGFAHLKVISTRTPFGTLYVPQDGKPTHPGIIVLHGSEGGGRAFNALDAQLFGI